MKNKSLFSSTTVWGAVLSCWLAVSPNLKSALEYGFSPATLIDMLDSVVATVVVIIGRYNADTIVYTPKYIIGRNKDDRQNENQS